MHTISRVFASKSLGTKNFQYSVLFCIHFLEFCIKILVKYTFLEQRHVLLTISGAFASKSLGSKKSQYCVIQRQGIDLVVLDLACHVIGLNAGCLWVTPSAIPALHKCRFCTSKMIEICLRCHWLYFSSTTLSFGQGGCRLIVDY